MRSQRTTYHFTPQLTMVTRTPLARYQFTELHSTRHSFLFQHPCSLRVGARRYEKPPKLCAPSFFLLDQPLEDCSSPPRAGFHSHGHAELLPGYCRLGAMSQANGVTMLFFTNTEGSLCLSNMLCTACLAVSRVNNMR